MALDISHLKDVATSAIDAASSSLHGISKHIWSNPELGHSEHSAHAVLTDYLEKAGFSVERKYLLETGFRATFGGEGGPHVAVMCEYDALPGIGHACGHNLIAEVGVAAGLGIKAAMEAAGKPIGKVTVLGSPAEEGGGGKIYLIEGGAFKDISVAMMAHPAPGSRAAVPMLANNPVHVTYNGRASHAGVAPWEGLNALDAAVMAYQSISCLRQQMKPTWRVHGVFTSAGERPNVIPEESGLYYYVRTPTMGDMKTLKKKMTDCFNAAATATGCKVKVEWTKTPYQNLLTNATLCALYEANAAALNIEMEDRDEVGTPTGSTDMGNVSHVVPSIHPMYYIGAEVMNHTREFTPAAGADKAQPYTLDQGKALAMTATDVLCNPDLVPKMKKELEDDLKRDGGN